MVQHGYERVLGPYGALHNLFYTGADEPQSCHRRRTEFGFWAFSKGHNYIMQCSTAQMIHSRDLHHESREEKAVWCTAGQFDERPIPH